MMRGASGTPRSRNPSSKIFDDDLRRRSLLGLNFDSFRQIDGATHWIANLNRAAMTQVCCNHSGLGPIQIPSVLDRQNVVGTWYDILQIKGTVEIALIPAEKVAVSLRVLGTRTTIAPAKGLPARFAVPSTFRLALTTVSETEGEEPAFTVIVWPEASAPSAEMCTMEYGLSEPKTSTSYRPAAICANSASPFGLIACTPAKTLLPERNPTVRCGGRVVSPGSCTDTLIVLRASPLVVSISSPSLLRSTPLIWTAGPAPWRRTL